MSKLLIASAGSGKTRYIIESLAEKRGQNIAVLTYTIKNKEEIESRVIRRYGCIPSGVKVYTWFSFWLRHGVKPYLNQLTSVNANGIILVNSPSGHKGYNKAGYKTFFNDREEFDKHYFTSKGRVYSDKLTKLVMQIDKVTKKAVLNRLKEIYSTIYVDEVQDLAGNDLELIRKLLLLRFDVVMVGDPRQVIYLTHLERKHKQYRGGRITDFILDKCSRYSEIIDTDTLSGSHRCCQQICDFSNLFYPQLPKANSKQKIKTDHDGVFLVRKNDVPDYLSRFNPIQLRWNIRAKTNPNYDSLNIGVAKGLGFDRVLIYPTQGMKKWLSDKSFQLSDKARAQFYVAVTRARFSVGIICDDEAFGIQVYSK